MHFTAPSHPLRRCLMLVAMCIPLLVALGCTAGAQSRNFPDHLKISYRGGELDPEIWNAPAQTEGDALPFKNRAISWILPVTFYQRGIQFESTQRIHTRSASYNDLGLPIFLLPLRFQYSESLYTPESTEPQSRQWAALTPFWATSHRENWPEDRGRIRARGVPIFFGRVDVDSDDQKIGLFNSLWSLGPAYVYFSDLEIPMERGGSGSVEATVGMPFALGGLPGALLWFSAELDSQNPGEDVRYSAHGPIMGLLGYTSNRVTERMLAEAPEGGLATEGGPEMVERRSFFHLATLGILWMSTGTKEVGNSRSEYAAHGPLWGIFGWGKSSGRNAVRLLWFQIPVQGYGPEGE